MVAKTLFAGVAVILAVQIPLVLTSGSRREWFYVVPLAAVCVYQSALGVAARHTRTSVASVGLACLVAASYATLVSPSFLSPSNEFLTAIAGATALPVLSAMLASDLRQLSGRRGWLVLGSGVVAALILLYGGDVALRYALHE